MENCPYCGELVEINHDDGYGFDEDTEHQQTCPSCDKVFTFQTMIIFRYTLKKAPCLNDEGDHKWNERSGWGVNGPYRRNVCDVCGESGPIRYLEPKP